MSYRAGEGYQWVGDHIRPRVRVPEEWHWPVNVSLSTEIGYQRRSYSTDTWTWEIRPIVDKQLGRWYLAFNPAVDRSFHGLEVSKGVTFAPNVKVSYNVTKKVGFRSRILRRARLHHRFRSAARPAAGASIPAIDLDLGPNWEFNFGPGIGVTERHRSSAGENDPGSTL